MPLARQFGGDGSGGGIVERMVGDQIFTDFAALANWSNANRNLLRNNNDPITADNPWNKSIAQIGVSPNQDIYQWDGENQSSSLPAEIPWTLRDRTLNASQIKTLYESNANTNAYDDADNATVTSVQGAQAGRLLMATATGAQASSVSEEADRFVFSKSIQVPPGSTLLGELRLSDSVQALGITTSTGDIGFLPHSVVTLTGTDGPVSYTLGNRLDLTLNSTNTANLPDPFSFTYETGGAATFSFTTDVLYQPAEAGTLRVEVFLGTDDTGALIFDDTHEYTQADVDSGAFISFDVGNNYLTPAGQDLFLRYSGIQLKGGVGAPGEVLAGINAPAFRIQSYPGDQVDLTHENNVVPQIEGKSGDDRLDYNALKNTPTISGDATRRYTDIEYRRTNFTLGLLSTDTDAPGDLYRVETASTVTLPASTSDSQLGLHWGIQNVSIGQTVTIQPDTPAGHTVVIEGLTRPYELPSGVSIDLVLVDRTANSSNYRIMNMSSGIEGLMGVHSIVGTSINIFGISGRPVHYKLNTIGTANFSSTIAGVGLLPQGESCRALIENISTTYGLNLRVPTGTNFKGTNTEIIAIEPGVSRWITITNQAGTLEVDIDGPVSYEFMIQSHDITNTGDNKGDWGGTGLQGIPSVYSEIISSPTLLAERDRLEAESGAGFILKFNLMADIIHGSGNSGDTALFSVRGDRNDGGGAGVIGPTSTRRATGGVGAAQEVPEFNKTWIVTMNSGNHFNLLLNGFPLTGAAGARLIEPWALVKVIMKR